MILVYHGVAPDTADSLHERVARMLPAGVLARHLRWLSRRCNVIPLAEYVHRLETDGRVARRTVALTFDDGLASTLECTAPLLEAFQVPATFFVCTQGFDGGGHLWFSYLNALCCSRHYSSVELPSGVLTLGSARQRRRARLLLDALACASRDPREFVQELSARYPLGCGDADLYRCSSAEIVSRAAQSDLIEIGGHSVTHPLLSRLPPSVQQREISRNAGQLAEAVGTVLRYFAYPGGDYNRDTVRLVAGAGYQCAAALAPSGCGGDWRFELARVGVYSRSLSKVRLKVLGLADVARRLGLRVG